MNARSTASIIQYLADHGRLPRLGDPVAPWEHRGWLLMYVWLAEAQGLIPPRWDYFSAVSTGSLPAEPIPSLNITDVHAAGASGAAARRELDNALRIIGHGGHLGYGWAAFGHLVDWLGWGLATADEPPALDYDVQEKLYRSFNLEPFLLGPADYLGEYAAEKHGSGWNPGAFFPTPMSICRLMADMQLGPDAGEDLRLRSVLDCCVGSGRLLLAASGRSLLLYGQDIDGLMVRITKINGALYAPWICRGIPTDVLPELRRQQDERRAQRAGLRERVALVRRLLEGGEDGEAARGLLGQPAAAQGEDRAPSAGTPPQPGDQPVQLGLFGGGGAT